MTTTTVEVMGEATKSTTGVDDGMDVSFLVTLPDGSTIDGEVTLIPATNGRQEYVSWGDLTNWMDGRSIEALRAALSGDDLRETINAIEAATSHACGCP